MIELRISRIERGGRRPALPAYQTAGAAAFDLAAFLDAPLTIPAGGRALVPTGLRVAVPAGYGGFVFARSGLSVRSGIAMANGVGLVDSDYRGELLVPVVNLADEAFTVTDGMRVAQFLLLETPRAVFAECADLGETARGAQGFGSTGTGARPC